MLEKTAFASAAGSKKCWLTGFRNKGLGLWVQTGSIHKVQNLRRGLVWDSFLYRTNPEEIGAAFPSDWHETRAEVESLVFWFGP